MKSLLATHQRSLSHSDHLVVSAAARQGWGVRCLATNDEYGWNDLGTVPRVRYYGNTARRTFSRCRLPVTFNEIDPSVLPSLSWATRRDITLMSLFDLVQPLARPLFVKPVQGKWFPSRVYDQGATISAPPDQLGTSDPRDRLIYVGEPVRFGAEVRCWCLNGEILTWSIYRGAPQEVDLSPVAALVGHIHQTVPSLPRSIVMDFGQGPDDEWSLVEFNKPWAAALYGCDPDQCFDCIVESQTDAPHIPLR